MKNILKTLVIASSVFASSVFANEIKVVGTVLTSSLNKSKTVVENIIDSTLINAEKLGAVGTESTKIILNADNNKNCKFTILENAKKEIVEVGSSKECLNGHFTIYKDFLIEKERIGIRKTLIENRDIKVIKSKKLGQRVIVNPFSSISKLEDEYQLNIIKNYIGTRFLKNKKLLRVVDVKENKTIALEDIQNAMILRFKNLETDCSIVFLIQEDSIEIRKVSKECDDNQKINIASEKYRFYIGFDSDREEAISIKDFRESKNLLGKDTLKVISK